MNKKILFSIVVGVIITGATLWISIIIIDVTQFEEIVHTAHTPLIIASFIFAALSQFMRTWRLSIVLEKRCDFGLFSLICKHQFWANLLPFRTGEAILPIYLKYQYGIPFLRGGGILIILRLYDLITILALGGIAAFFAFQDTSELIILNPAFLIGGLLATFILGCLPLIANHLNKRPLPEKIHRLTNSINSLNSTTIVMVIVSTFATWVCVFASYTTAFYALGLYIQLEEILTVSAAGALAFALPISGFAGIGPFEAAIATTLSLLGYSNHHSLLGAIAAHLTTFSAGAFLALSVSVLETGKKYYHGHGTK